MPSDFLTPFLELDEEFCKNFRGLEATDGSSMGATTLQQQQEQQLQQLQQLQNQLTQNQQSQHSLRVLGFQRRHSLCPVTLPNSKFNHNNSSISGSSTPSSADMMPDSASSFWASGLSNMAPTSTAQQQMQWNREAQNQLPRSALSHIPFRVDRSVSMIEGSSNVNSLRDDKILLPPPGLCLSNTSLSSSIASKLTPPSPLQLATEPVTPPPHISTRYKTELCRTFEESGTCKYGAKCQFAHGMDEMRGLSRHPKYKTEPCRTFHTIGFCPYGARCHFIHNADEILQAGNPPPKHNKLRPFLRHSVSFAGFSSTPQTFQPLDLDVGNSTSLLFARANSVSPPPSATESPELFSPLYPDTTASLKNRNYPFSGVSDLPVDSSGDLNSGLRFYAVNESTYPSKKPNLPFQMPAPTANAPPGLQRCSSADSLSEEGYTSSCSISSASSGTESPSFEGRRLPIFSRLSVSDE